jgi:hypothetical protein
MSVKVHGVLARFETPEALIDASAKMAGEGYSSWEAHSPYPLHGLDAAAKEKPSELGWIVAVMALLGFVVGLGLQWWTHTQAYPLITSGKVLFSYQAFFPVTFSATVLFSVFAAVFGMIGLINQRFNHPVFYSDNFGRFSDDAFFISVLASDPKFDQQSTGEFLRSMGGLEIELLEEK